MELQVKPLAMAVVVMAAMSFAGVPQAVAGDAALIEKGKKIAEDRRKGNCFGCHSYAGAVLPGNGGPPLVAMKARFPDKAALRAQIWDPTARNKNAAMPPMGKHGILTEEEIDAVTEWVHSL